MVKKSCPISAHTEMYEKKLCPISAYAEMYSKKK